MTPEIVRTIHIYPEGSGDIYRYTLVSEHEACGGKGVTIKLEERPEAGKPYNTEAFICLDLDDAKAVYLAIKELIDKVALVPDPDLEESNPQA